METKERYFPTQEAGEKIFLLIRRHWIVFATILFFVLIMIMPLVALGIYWFLNPEVFSEALGNFIVIFAGIYSLIIIGLCLYGFVNYYLDVYIITDERVVDIKQSGFFRREIAELHLRQVQDVEARVEGFFGTMLHFGNVHIQTAGERENFILEDVPHPYTVSKRIAELHQRHIHPARAVADRHEENGAENTMPKVDDYRVEDYSPYVSKNAVSESTKEAVIDKPAPKQQISSVEEIPERKSDLSADSKLEEPAEEIGFGAANPNADQEKELSKELQELSEGEEVKFDD